MSRSSLTEVEAAMAARETWVFSQDWRQNTGEERGRPHQDQQAGRHPNRVVSVGA